MDLTVTYPAKSSIHGAGQDCLGVHYHWSLGDFESLLEANFHQVLNQRWTQEITCSSTHTSEMNSHTSNSNFLW